MCRWNAWPGVEVLLAFVEFVPDLHSLISGCQPLIFGQRPAGLLAFKNPLAGFVPAFTTPMSNVPVQPTGGATAGVVPERDAFISDPPTSSTTSAREPPARFP